MAVDRSRFPGPTRIALLERDSLDHAEQLADHEQRLRPLERFHVRAAVFAGIGAAVGSATVTAVAGALAIYLFT